MKYLTNKEFETYKDSLTMSYEDKAILIDPNSVIGEWSEPHQTGFLDNSVWFDEEQRLFTDTQKRHLNDWLSEKAIQGYRDDVEFNKISDETYR